MWHTGRSERTCRLPACLELLWTCYREVANLLQTCYGETGVMNFGLNDSSYDVNCTPSDLCEFMWFSSIWQLMIVRKPMLDVDWFRSGRHLTDDEVAGMLIGLLLAGQHTSSTTSSWLGFFLAKHPDIQVSEFWNYVQTAPISFVRSFLACTTMSA